MEEGQLRCSDSDFWILNSVEELRVLIASQFLQVEFQTGRAIHRKGNVKVTPSQTHCLVVWDRCQAGCKSKDSQWGADLLLGTEGKGLMCFRWLIRETTSISDAFSSCDPNPGGAQYYSEDRHSDGCGVPTNVSNFGPVKRAQQRAVWWTLRLCRLTSAEP